MTQYVRVPRSDPEWGTLMVGLMVLYGLAQLALFNASLYEALILGVFIGGTTAIFLMVIYVFWRGI